jgi:hypothetical protein
VAVLVGVREGEPVEFRPPGIAELLLQRLPSDACRELIAQSAAGPVSVDVSNRLQDSTRGNPLAILESIKVLESPNDGNWRYVNVQPSDSIQDTGA